MKYHFDNVQDIEPENITEEDNLEGREISGDQVEKDIEEHAENIKEAGSNPTNSEQDGPTRVEAEIVDEKTEKAGSLINGKMLIFMLDVVIPLIIKYVGEASSKKIEIDIDALKMDDEEKELLGPSAEHVAELIFGKLGPIAQFFVGYGIIISSKVPDAIKKKDQ